MNLNDYKLKIYKCKNKLCKNIFIINEEEKCPKCKKKAVNISYKEIAEAAGLGSDATFRAIKYPWRTRLSTILQIAPVIGIPEAEAEKIWKEAKRKYQLQKYS